MDLLPHLARAIQALVSVTVTQLHVQAQVTELYVYMSDLCKQ